MFETKVFYPLLARLSRPPIYSTALMTVSNFVNVALAGSNFSLPHPILRCPLFCQHVKSRPSPLDVSLIEVRRGQLLFRKIFSLHLLIMFPSYQTRSISAASCCVLYVISIHRQISTWHLTVPISTLLSCQARMPLSVRLPQPKTTLAHQHC